MRRDFLVTRTNLAAMRKRSILESARKLTDDPDREARVEKCLCVVCHYGSRLGGAAITNQPCMSCGKDQTFSSTDTDVLCLDCAKAGRLCAHCGADIDLKVGRRNWPEPINPPEKEV